MKITYTLTKDDILQMQLFMASLSEQVRKTRRKTHLRVPIVYLVLAVVLLICSDWIAGILFIGVAIVWYFAYPTYQAKQYVKYYAKHVDENLAKRTAQPTELIFGDEYISATDYSGESKLKISIIERIDEVRDYCFLKLNSGICRDAIYDALNDYVNICRDAIYDVSTGGTGGNEQSLKNEKMQIIANKCGRLSHVISNFKSAVTRYSNYMHINFAWQTRFHDHIVRDQEEMNRIASYIENNVLTWKEDKFYTE